MTFHVKRASPARASSLARLSLVRIVRSMHTSKAIIAVDFELTRAEEAERAWFAAHPGASDVDHDRAAAEGNDEFDRVGDASIAYADATLTDVPSNGHFAAWTTPRDAAVALLALVPQRGRDDARSLLEGLLEAAFEAGVDFQKAAR